MKSEHELVENALRGNQRSFERLLHPYRQGLLNMAYRMTGNLEEAKEICQEALIKIFKYLGKFKKGRSFKSWVYKITVNSTYDYMRKKRKYEDILQHQKSPVISTASDPEKQFLNKEIQATIEACLQLLSPKEKIIFLLRDEGEFSIRETSDICGCSSLSVRTHLSRARRKIKERFNEFYRIREVEQ